MRKLLYAATFLTLFHSAGWVEAQTIKERLDKARTEVNLVENTADRAVYACSRNQQPKCTDEARAAKNAASRALYAIDQALKSLQPVPEPTPTPVPEPTPDPVPEPVPEPTPTPTPTYNDNVLAAEGNSLTAHAGAYQRLYDAARSNVTVCTTAVGGSDIAMVIGRAAKVDTCNPEAVSLLIGPNDMLTTPNFVEKVLTYADSQRAKGRKVILLTIPPQQNDAAERLSPGYIAKFENMRVNQVNPAFRAAVGTRVDAIVDIAADPRIGDLADAADPTLYGSDKLHMTAKAYAIVQELFAPVADRVLGLTSTPAPTPTPTPTPEPTPTPTPTPVPTVGTLKAITACKGVYPIDVTVVNNVVQPVYGNLTTGQSYPVIPQKAITHDNKLLRGVTIPSGHTTYFAESCFG